MAALVVALFVSTASAQQPCDERAQILKRLHSQYSETPKALGITQDGSVVELLTSPQTWTIILTTPKGVTCMISAGSHWMNIEQVKGQKL